MPVKTQVIDFANLKQAQVAWLTGKSPDWLRSHAANFKRNPDGSYDGREVFQTLAKLIGSTTISSDSVWDAIATVKNPANCGLCKNGILESCEIHGVDGYWLNGQTVF